MEPQGLRFFSVEGTRLVLFERGEHKAIIRVRDEPVC